MIPPDIARAAYATGKKYNLLPTAILSQWALETGWGKSQCSARNNNPFNIKGCEGHNVTGCSRCRDTIENSNSNYRTYTTLEAGFDGYGYLLATSSRYKAVVGIRDARQFFQILKDGGYATDKAYVEKLLKVHTEVLKNIPPGFETNYLVRSLLVAAVAAGLYGMYKYL